MILAGFISLLKTEPTVSALIADRVYKSVLPRAFVLPAVVVHRYNAVQEYDFEGPTGVSEDNVQFDAYGRDADECDFLQSAIRDFLVSFKGVLPDGSIVQACYLERDLDMPYLPNADQRGAANRSLLGFRVVFQRT